MTGRNYSSLPTTDFTTSLPVTPQHPQSGNTDLDDLFAGNDERQENNMINATNQTTNDTPQTVDYPHDLPPAYDPAGFERFEIEEPEQASSDINTSAGFRNKAEEIAQSFNKHIVQPINNALDPIYQLYCFLNAKFEYYMEMLGNPLIVKRFFYILFVAGVLYIASLSGLNSDGVVGSHSDFMDHNKLDEFINVSVDNRRLEENLQYLSSMPHLAGTAGDLALARYFQQLVLQSKYVTSPDISYETYTNYPKDPKVEIIENNEVILSFDLKEKLDDNYDNDFYKLAFNPGSRDMKSKGKIIYANYGDLTDYEMLHQNSIDVKGCILVIKYGGLHPAFKKLRYAQEKGAIGVLFISDPKLDRYYNLESLQREPVGFIDNNPGNLVSPGASSSSLLDHDGDLRAELDNSNAMPDIPSMPIKWKDFISLMEKMENTGSRISEWDLNIDGKSIEVWTGSKENSLEVSLNNSLTQKPHKESWSIIGKLEGKEQDTLALIIGASRDTSCYGAIESSGSAVLLELMNIFTEMSSSLSWRPLRSIYFVSFSGSKYNFAGATHFATMNSEFFRRDVFSFIDLDDIIQNGETLDVSADPLFESAIREVINKYKQNLNTTEQLKIFENINFNHDINPLSNSFPLIEHHNVGSIALKLKSSDNFAIADYPKNSCLDTFENFQRLNFDSDMVKHSLMTKLVASIIVKLSDTPILPYDIDNFISEIRANIEDINQYCINKKGIKLNFHQLNQNLDNIQIISDQNKAFIKTWSEIVDNGYGSEPNLLSVNRWDWNSKLLLMTKVMHDIKMNNCHVHVQY